jgi:hypothetical protein
MPRGSSGGGGGLHYAKSGALDMRYSSSREAVESGFSVCSFDEDEETLSDDIGSGYSSSGAELHYKKDGSLDMRYSSSREASGYPSNLASSSSSSDSLHCKKDGSLDMRYSSSKTAAATTNTSTGDSLHFKKDGTLDMRYNSSKMSGLPAALSESSGLHYKKDGSPDMRFSSSRVAAGLSYELKAMQLSSNKTRKLSRQSGIPDYVPLKTDGTPDMRTNAAKDWVASQAAKWDGSHLNIPSWVPKRKDGSIDLNSAIGRAFLECSSSHINPHLSELRSNYWRKRLADPHFLQYLMAERKENVVLPPRPPVIDSPLSRPRYAQMSLADGGTSRDYLLPKNTVEIDYSSLKFDRGDEKAAELGRGSFGVVMKATLNGKTVAVKKLHLDRLTRKERDSFIKELQILAHLGTHPQSCRIVRLLFESIVFGNGACEVGNSI